MLDKEKWKKSFSLFVDNGYITKFDNDTVYFYGATQGIVLRVHVSPVEESIRAGIYQFSVGEMPEEKILESAGDLAFDLDEKTACYFVKLKSEKGQKNAIDELVEKLLANEKYRLFNLSFRQLVSEKCNNLIDRYKLQTTSKKFCSMVESVYLWNKKFGVEISRDYYEWQISCTFFKCDVITNDYITIDRITAPWKVDNEFPKEAAILESLYDPEQVDYLVRLDQLLNSGKLDLTLLVADESIDWTIVDSQSNKVSLKKQNT